jgi:hypothetical protein
MAQRFYRLQLWAAYQQVARCYGALMLTIWIDFCQDQDLRPSLVEQQLFSCMHRPQFYLGGLPLAFFNRPQLGWVIGPLLDLWGRECFIPESYDPLTQLLGLYGATASERRKVDSAIQADKRARGKKRAGSHGVRVGDSDGVLEASGDDSTGTDSVHATRVYRDPAIELDNAEDFPQITSPACPKCGRTLLLLGSPTKTDNRWTLVEVQCERCDEHSRYVRIDLGCWPG